MVCSYPEGRKMKDSEKIEVAEKRIKELHDADDLKKLQEQEKAKITEFYEQRSKSRVETAMLIFSYSDDAKTNKQNEVSSEYKDYGEVVAASYYAMYYIVHAYIAKRYGLKLREDIRGVHAITQQLVLYYLVKTNQLAMHLYNEYLKTMEDTVGLQNITMDNFQKEAFKYAEKYEGSKNAREIFTYDVTKNVEKYHAKKALETAEQFIGKIRDIMR